MTGDTEDLAYNLGRGSLLFADGAFLALGEMGDLAWLDLSPVRLQESSTTPGCSPPRETYTLPPS